ncbi:MAG: efflux RND transporter periplasmic adaptor subunit [Planctomycetota bacterium]
MKFRLDPCVAAALLSFACIRQPEVSSTAEEPPAITDRIHVPQSVIGNLGVSFQVAERGVLKKWCTLSGELVIRDDRQWTLLSPLRGRVDFMAPRWSSLRAGDQVARLSSPELLEARRALAVARDIAEDAAEVIRSTEERQAESRACIGEAESLERACRQRLKELLELQQGENALAAAEVLSARRALAEASRMRLDTAMANDALRVKLNSHRRRAREAEWKADEAAAQLRLLTSDTQAALGTVIHGRGTTLAKTSDDVLVVPAPASAVVIERHASPGMIVESGAPLARLAAFDVLEFQGFLPEGDAGTIPPDARVTLEFTSEAIDAVDTLLLSARPVALEGSRLLMVTADVPNAEGLLASGMSARAHVEVGGRSAEEVLVPAESVVYDGLEAVVFKRDDADPDYVIRTPVEVGSRARDRIEVFTGVLAGDLIVVDGVHQLIETGLGKTPENGHFHADGTWHAAHE